MEFTICRWCPEEANRRGSAEDAGDGAVGGHGGQVRGPGLHPRLGVCALSRRATAPRLCPVAPLPAHAGPLRRVHQRPGRAQRGNLKCFPVCLSVGKITSGICLNLQAHLYRLIEEAGITYVSIGHRRTLFNFHSQVLRISKSDSALNWSVEPINPARYVPTQSATPS